MTGLPAWLTLSVVLTGCASTGGQDWLNAPLAPLQRHAQLEPPVAETPAAGFDSRPRLNHTVTLGESYLIESNRVYGAGPLIQVNVQTPVPVVVNNGYGYGYGYGYNSYAYNGYGYARGASVRATSARTTSAPTRVGGNFPPPADYGPRAMR